MNNLSESFTEESRRRIRRSGLLAGMDNPFETVNAASESAPTPNPLLINKISRR